MTLKSLPCTAFIRMPNYRHLSMIKASKWEKFPTARSWTTSSKSWILRWSMPLLYRVDTSISHAESWRILIMKLNLRVYLDTKSVTSPHATVPNSRPKLHLHKLVWSRAWSQVVKNLLNLQTKRSKVWVCYFSNSGVTMRHNLMSLV